MKPFAFFSVFLTLCFFTTINLQAQPVMKEKAANVIKRTAVALDAAHKATSENKVYTGNLKLAVIHQQFSIELFNEGKYMRAIHHSQRARELSRLQLEANSVICPEGYEANFDEKPDGPKPDAEALDDDANKSQFSKIVADDKILSSNPLKNIDLSE